MVSKQWWTLTDGLRAKKKKKIHLLNLKLLCQDNWHLSITNNTVWKLTKILPQLYNVKPYLWLSCKVLTIIIVLHIHHHIILNLHIKFISIHWIVKLHNKIRSCNILKLENISFNGILPSISTNDTYFSHRISSKSLNSFRGC